jgi:uncharacterized protein (DUF3084 family)
MQQQIDATKKEIIARNDTLQAYLDNRTNELRETRNELSEERQKSTDLASTVTRQQERITTLESTIAELGKSKTKELTAKDTTIRSKDDIILVKDTSIADMTMHLEADAAKTQRLRTELKAKEDCVQQLSSDLDNACTFIEGHMSMANGLHNSFAAYTAARNDSVVVRQTGFGWMQPRTESDKKGEN